MPGRGAKSRRSNASSFKVGTVMLAAAALFAMPATAEPTLHEVYQAAESGSLAQWSAPPQDSMPISQPGSAVSSNTLSQLARVSFRRPSAYSWRPTPCT